MSSFEPEAKHPPGPAKQLARVEASQRFKRRVNINDGSLRVPGIDDDRPEGVQFQRLHKNLYIYIYHIFI